MSYVLPRILRCENPLFQFPRSLSGPQETPRADRVMNLMQARDVKSRDTSASIVDSRMCGSGNLRFRYRVGTDAVREQGRGTVRQGGWRKQFEVVPGDIGRRRRGSDQRALTREERLSCATTVSAGIENLYEQMLVKCPRRHLSRRFLLHPRSRLRRIPGSVPDWGKAGR